jgi:hypothetical protein
VPATLNECHPLWITSGGGEEPEGLSVAGGPVTPAVAKTLNQLGSVLRVRVRHKEAIARGFVAPHNVGGTREGEIHKIRALRSDALRAERLDDPEGAVRYVVKPSRGADAVFPIDPESRFVRVVHVRDYGVNREIEIANAQCPQRNAGISPEQFKLIAPAFSVKTRANEFQDRSCGCTGNRITESFEHRLERHRDAREAKI